MSHVAVSRVWEGTGEKVSHVTVSGAWEGQRKRCHM